MAGDEVCGTYPTLRRIIRAHGLGYVLQVAANRRMPTHAGPIRVDRLPDRLPAARGSDCPPEPAATASGSTPGPGSRCNSRTPPASWPIWLLCPRRVPLRTVVAVAGQRWRIEEAFQAAKGLVGLDQHQVRRLTSWHRCTTLAMLAHAFLAMATAIERDTRPTPVGLIELTVNEFRRLFDALLLGARATQTTLMSWSHWRRHHEHRARECHY